MVQKQNMNTLLLVSIAALLAVGSIFVTAQITSGQMMVGSNMTFKNMNQTRGPGMMSFVLKGENITGSINLMSTISKAITSEVKVSLSEAAAAAEKSVGNDSHAVAAHIGSENGYLVYNVGVINPNGKVTKVVIDPANGKILLSRELSEFESMIVMHQGMMMGGGMMDRGMMDRGMMGQGPGW